eukprot:g2940.t1
MSDLLNASARGLSAASVKSSVANQSSRGENTLSFLKSYSDLHHWATSSLDKYRHEFTSQLLFPIFTLCVLYASEKEWKQQSNEGIPTSERYQLLSRFGAFHSSHGHEQAVKALHLQTATRFLYKAFLSDLEANPSKTKNVFSAILTQRKVMKPESAWLSTPLHSSLSSASSAIATIRKLLFPVSISPGTYAFLIHFLDSGRYLILLSLMNYHLDFSGHISDSTQTATDSSSLSKGESMSVEEQTSTGTTNDPPTATNNDKVSSLPTVDWGCMLLPCAKPFSRQAALLTKRDYEQKNAHHSLFLSKPSTLLNSASLNLVADEKEIKNINFEVNQVARNLQGPLPVSHAMRDFAQQVDTLDNETLREAGISAGSKRGRDDKDLLADLKIAAAMERNLWAIYLGECLRTKVHELPACVREMEAQDIRERKAIRWVQRSKVMDQNQEKHRPHESASMTTTTLASDENKNRLDIDILTHTLLDARINLGAQEIFHCADISRDGSTMIAGAQDSSLRLWRLDGNQVGELYGRSTDWSSINRQQEIATALATSASGFRLIGHQAPVFATSLSANLDYCVSGSSDGEIRLWDLSRHGRAEGGWTNDGPLETSASLEGPLGAMLCVHSARSHVLPVWDIDICKSLGTGGGCGLNTFASCSGDQTGIVWDCGSVNNDCGIVRPVRVLMGHSSDIHAIKFHPNGAYIGTASEDGSAQLWDLRTARSVRSFNIGNGSPAWKIAYSSDGRLIAVGYQNADSFSVDIYDIPSGKSILRCTPPQKSLDGKCIVLSTLSFSKVILTKTNGGVAGGDFVLVATSLHPDFAVMTWHSQHLLQQQQAKRVGATTGCFPTQIVPSKSTSMLHGSFTERNLFITCGILR